MSDTKPTIDLAGLDSKWSKSGRQLCAVCGRDFDNQDAFTEDEMEEGDHVPLHLFRGKGKKTEMLTLCWKCAEPRMKAKQEPEQSANLGPCCICEGMENVRNVLNLPFRSPTSGRGWGCFVCGRAPDGAIAVLCDRCFDSLKGDGDASRDLRFVCTGYAATDGRTPISEVSGTSFNHDLSFHQDERPTN